MGNLEIININQDQGFVTHSATIPPVPWTSLYLSPWVYSSLKMHELTLALQCFSPEKSRFRVRAWSIAILRFFIEDLTITVRDSRPFITLETRLGGTEIRISVLSELNCEKSAIQFFGLYEI